MDEGLYGLEMTVISQLLHTVASPMEFDSFFQTLEEGLKAAMQTEPPTTLPNMSLLSTSGLIMVDVDQPQFTEEEFLYMPEAPSTSYVHHSASSRPVPSPSTSSSSVRPIPLSQIYLPSSLPTYHNLQPLSQLPPPSSIPVSHPSSSRTAPMPTGSVQDTEMDTLAESIEGPIEVDQSHGTIQDTPMQEATLVEAELAGVFGGGSPLSSLPDDDQSENESREHLVAKVSSDKGKRPLDFPSSPTQPSRVQPSRVQPSRVQPSRQPSGAQPKRGKKRSKPSLSSPLQPKRPKKRTKHAVISDSDEKHGSSSEGSESSLESEDQIHLPEFGIASVSATHISRNVIKC